MFRAFNMGIGLVIACAADDADRVMTTLGAAGEPSAVRVGRVTAGDQVVHYVGVS
jgi:phosphoribosylaminoimidazole (AIR) synthetase